ncbi:MAG TPA: DUF427 domain-containing protein [Candidatus Baltobacteraceae bacterium]|nr:DUF427 domain-containing protein [Candidatus Baltobacteraceae bacterium]
MSKNARHLTILETRSRHPLVSAEVGQYQEIEGNWYVDPEAVDQNVLKTSRHEYHCPYKGRCFYVDFDDGKSRVERVAWIYDDPQSGWGHIKGRYGFYAGSTAAKFGKTKETLS